MATITPFSAIVFLVVFANSRVLISTTDEPTTFSASPAVPYVTAPDISSFFPTPSGVDPGTWSSAASPEAEAPAPISGEFVGKRSSSSTRLDCAAAIAGILLISSFLVTSMVV